MRRYLLFGLLLLLVPALAQAEFFVCGDSNSLQQVFYRDLSLSRPGNCSAVAEGSIAAQLALMASVVRFDYLKVVSGLAVEKTQGEKDAVDAAIAATNAAIAAVASELSGSTTCNAADLATVNSRLATRKATLDAAIDGIAAANLTTLKAGLHGVVDDEYVVLQAIARCVVALIRLNR